MFIEVCWATYWVYASGSDIRGAISQLQVVCITEEGRILFRGTLQNNQNFVSGFAGVKRCSCRECIKRIRRVILTLSSNRRQKLVRRCSPSSISSPQTCRNSLSPLPLGHLGRMQSSHMVSRRRLAIAAQHGDCAERGTGHQYRHQPRHR